MEANDLWGTTNIVSKLIVFQRDVANLDSSGTIGSICVGNHPTLLHSKYISFFMCLVVLRTERRMTVENSS